MTDPTDARAHETELERQAWEAYERGEACYCGLPWPECSFDDPDRYPEHRVRGIALALLDASAQTPDVYAKHFRHLFKTDGYDLYEHLYDVLDDIRANKHVRSETAYMFGVLRIIDRDGGTW